MLAPDSPRHWPFLDMVRGLAAILVMLGHARGHYFPEFAALDTPGPFIKAFYVLTGLQHEAVVLFFIVSGFLVGGSAWHAFAARRFEATRYVANRFVRIYLVFIPSLVVSLAIYVIGTTWLGDTAAFSALPQQPWSNRDTICHAACLQGIYCSVFAANAPLWSLSYEWLLYLVAPLFLALAYASLGTWQRALGLLLLSATLVSVIPGHLQWSWLLFWAMGACASRYASQWSLSGAIGIAALASAAVGMVVARASVLPVQATDLWIATGFSLAVANNTILAYSPAPKFFAYLAAISFSLYATHKPLLTFAASVIERLTGNSGHGHAGPEGFIMFAGVAWAALLFAALFASLTEAHTRSLQRSLVGSRHPAGEAKTVESTRAGKGT